MYGIVLFLHVVVVVILIAVILVQRGRSSGLIEALGGVESIFGTRTSSFFVKATVVLAIVFFITSITLDYLSKQQRSSVVERVSSVESTPRGTESTEGKTTGGENAAQENTGKTPSSGKNSPVSRDNSPENSK